MTTKAGAEEFQLKQPSLKKKSKRYRVMSQAMATFGFGCLIFSVSSICTMPTVVIAGIYAAGGGDTNQKISGNATTILVTNFTNTSTLNVSNINQPDSDNLRNRDKMWLTDQQASWFGSIVYMVQPLGALSSGFIQDKFGRRRCMMGVTIPQFAGWLAIYFSTSTVVLFAATIIMSLSIGFMEAPAMSFIGETVEPKYRGVLSTFSQIFLLLGIVFEFIVGAVFSWRIACLVSAIIPVVAFSSIYVIPESPVWLVIKGKYEEAEKALCWLRGWTNIEEIRDEYNQLLFNLNINPGTHHFLRQNSAQRTLQEETRPLESSTFSQVKYLKQSRVYRPLIMVASYFFVCHCVSLNGLRPFQVGIFSELDMNISSYTALVILGAFLLCGAVCCSVFIRRLGKRGVTFVSLGCCSVFTLALSAYFYWNVNSPYVAVSLFSLVYLFSGFGILPLPWVLVCEIFPLDCRGIGAGLAAASCYIFAGLVIKTYMELRSAITLSGVLFVYGIIGIMGFIFLYFNLPETEGKTLQEIELHFRKRKSVLSQNRDQLTTREFINY